MADDLIGNWSVQMGDLELYHQMWMLEPKWRDGVLSYSSNFGFLAREVVGGLRGGSWAPILEALCWYGLVLGPLVGLCALWLRPPPWPWGRWLRTQRLVMGAVAAWLLVLAGVWGVAASTDLDRDYHHRRWTERKREIQPRRLPAGKRYTWNFSSNSPLESVRLVTFLTGAEEVESEEQVGLVVVSVDGKKKKRVPLLAGVDTADFLIDRPESLDTRGHGAPLEQAAWTYRVRDRSSHFYTAHAYVHTIRLPAGTRSGKVQVRSMVSEGELALAWLQVDEVPLARRFRRPRWLAERW